MQTISLCLTAACLVGTILPPSAACAADAPPNVVVIVADDVGYGDLSCYGGKIPTPNLDRLAAGGIRFTDFHSNGAMCSPTRAAFLTGRYQQRSGIENALDFFEPGLPPQKTLASRLQASGYTTGAFGKWHLGEMPASRPLAMGFDEFYGMLTGDGDHHSRIDRIGRPDWWHGNQPLVEAGYTTQLITKHALDFLRNHKGTPFFLYVPHLAPHFPWQGPAARADRVEGTDYRPGALKFGTQPDKRIAYREMVQAMDAGVGELLAGLAEAGLEKNTLVIFFSDNGGYTQDKGGYVGVSSNGPFRGQKGDVFEGGHRVPAIVWWPGHIRSGVVENATVMTADLFPTILEACGVWRVADAVGLDGVSLWPLLTRSEPLAKRMLYLRTKTAKAVRDGDWKLVVRNGGAQLYSLSADPGEAHDLAAAELPRVKAMQDALARWEQDVDASFHDLSRKNAATQPAQAR